METTFQPFTEEEKIFNILLYKEQCPRQVLTILTLAPHTPVCKAIGKSRVGIEKVEDGNKSEGAGMQKE